MASVKGVVGVVIAGSMFASSTAAVAAQSAPTAQMNPWAALAAMMAGAPAATMCGAAAAAAQAPGGCVLPAVDAPPVPVQTGEPLPPAAAAIAPASGIATIYPLLVALAVIAAAAGFYGLSKAKGNLGPLPIPNSPA